MLPDERMLVMRERLEKAFQPSRLEIIDDSLQHVGHAGNDGHAGHYTLLITAEVFRGQPLLNAHREIYAVLDDLIPAEIHALVIKIL